MKNTNKQISGKIFLITGASSGIGYETASQILNLGGIVYAMVRNPEPLSGLKKKYKDRLVITKGDVTKEKDCAGFARKAGQANKPVHSLIHCAGVGFRSSARNTSHDTFRKIMETNFYSMVYLYHASRDLIERYSGSIAVISSIQGKIALPYRSAYSAAKHALNAYIRCVRLEDTKIHFSLLNFGYVNTEFSSNALTGDGSRYLKKDRGQENGMRVHQAGKLVIDSLIKKKKEVTPAGLKEKFTLFVYRNFPVVYNLLITKFIKDE